MPFKQGNPDRYDPSKNMNNPYNTPKVDYNDVKKAAKAISRMPEKQKKAVFILAGIVAVIAIILAVLSSKGYLNTDSAQNGISGDTAPNAVENNGTSVHFIDVGQGDSALIISNGEAALIDAGEVEYGNTVLNYLNEQGIGSLKYIIVSHQHTDHMGGMSKILKNIKADELIMPPIPDRLFPTNSTYDKFLETLENTDIAVTEAENGTLTVGEVKLQMFVQSPDMPYESLNDFSIAIRAVHGDNAFLLCGDMEYDAEQVILESGFELSADVYKVNHHGSAGSSSYEFVEAVDPEYSVICVGANNDYGHPKQKALDRISKFCDKIYRTDLNGSIVFKSDGKELTLVLEKE